MTAAQFLGEMKVAEAVEPLVRAMESPLPLKSPANKVRLAAIAALVAIGDTRAVPALMRVLTTPSDEQNFLLNREAARALGVFADARAVQALIQGMFMMERGTSIFQECRLALVSIGAPAIPALMALLDPTNPESATLARRLNLVGSEVAKLPERGAMVLSAFGDQQSVPALVAAYRRPAIGDSTPKPANAESTADEALVARRQPTHEHATVLVALGLIGGSSATRTLLAVLKDKRASMERRTAAAESLAWSGDAKAIAALLAVATSSQKPIEGERDLRVYAATAAVHLASLGDSKTVRTVIDSLVRKNPRNDGLKHAQEGLAILERCSGDLPCLGKALGEPSSGLVEAAAFALAHSKDRPAALALLVGALTSVCDVTATLFQRRLVVLFAIRRLGDESSAEALATLDGFIERDEHCERLPGGRELLGETRITAAVLRHK